MADSAVTIKERGGLDMAQVSAWANTADSTRAALAEILGVQPPVQPNTVAGAGQTRIYWLGPHRWLVVRPVSGEPALAVELGALLPCTIAAVVDLGAGRRVFVVSGTRARDLLSKELPIDIHPSQFPPGRCVQSSMSHVGVMVHATAHDSFDVFVYRAFSQYFLEMLADAALEYESAGTPQ